jgi:hypothetical protein
MKTQTLRLPAGIEFVKFIDLAKLVAGAMHPGHDHNDLIALATAAATRSLKDELDRAAIHGVLPLKDPQTLAPCPFPLPMALVSVDDLRAYFEGRLTIEVEAVPGGCEPVQPEPLKVEAPAVAIGSMRETGQPWTDTQLAELTAYRKQHGTKAAAAHFGIGESRIRQLLPREKTVPSAHQRDPFGRTRKR